MTDRRTFLAALTTVPFGYTGRAADDPDADRRLGQMRAAVTALTPSTTVLKPAALAVGPTPLLRYSDPTRGGVKEENANNVLLDAAVWRLGGTGRPTALVTTEVYQLRTGERLLSFEFLSLTDERFTLTHPTEPVRWDATASGLARKELADAPRPAGTPAGRLAQMRQFARRFAARETFNKDTVECRLVAQPFDRYQSPAEKVIDGAVFALANGTNPEVGLLFEADGDGWRYAVLRLGAAEMVVSLDGQEVAKFEAFNSKGRTDGAYNSGLMPLPPAK